MDFLLTNNIKSLYQSQWASPKLINDIISHKLSALTDPRWKDFGFKTRKDYAFWSWRICAIACIKMALHFYHIDEKTSMAKITRECLTMKGYDRKKDQGWYHSALIQYLKQKGLQVKPVTLLSWDAIKESIVSKRLPMVSITENTREMNGDSGGHLILLIGVKENRYEKGVYYLDPARPDCPLKSKPTYMKYDSFQRIFLMRGIIIWSEQQYE